MCSPLCYNNSTIGPDPFTNVDHFSVVTHYVKVVAREIIKQWSMDIDPPSVCPTGGTATFEHHPGLLEAVPFSYG